MLEKSLKDDLLGFEQFLKNLGFKSLEGSIYGILVLTEGHLSAEEIQHKLGLSQSAVSNALKVLTNYNAISVKSSRERGCRLYQANEDCLEIVSTVFRKREQNIVRDYKLSIKRLRNKSLSQGESEDSLRMRRFNSILAVSEFGEVIVKFILALNELDPAQRRNLEKITDKLTGFFNIVTASPQQRQENIVGIKNLVGSKMKDYIDKITGEINE